MVRRRGTVTTAAAERRTERRAGTEQDDLEYRTAPDRTSSKQRLVSKQWWIYCWIGCGLVLPTGSRTAGVDRGWIHENCVGECAAGENAQKTGQAAGRTDKLHLILRGRGDGGGS